MQQCNIYLSITGHPLIPRGNIVNLSQPNVHVFELWEEPGVPAEVFVVEIQLFIFISIYF